MKNQKLKGNLMLFITALVWGVSFIAQSKGVEVLSPATFNGVRSVLGGVVLLPVIYLLDRGKIKRGESVQKADKTLIIGGISCGIILCLATTLQSMGMVYTSPGKAGFITALYMVIVPILGLFVGKKLNFTTVGAVLVAVLGMYLMCIKQELALNKGDLMILGCAFLFSGHILCIDYFSPRVDAVKLSCLQFFVCGIINLIWVFLFEEFKIGPVINSWAAIGYAGVMSCGVAYTLQAVGQKYTDPTSASILMSLESVFATLSTVILVALGWNLTGGQMSIREILGCVLMFAAIMLVQLPDITKKVRKNVNI